jgi:hypothetical protein
MVPAGLAGNLKLIARGRPADPGAHRQGPEAWLSHMDYPDSGPSEPCSRDPAEGYDRQRTRPPR